VEIRRHQDVIAFEVGHQEYLGFHGGNLELADLSQEAWESLNAENNTEAGQELATWAAEEMDLATLTTPKEIRSLSINIAQICNLACTYCGAGDGSYGSSVPKMDLEIAENQLRHFLSNVPEGERFEVRFMGGEPLLYPRLVERLARFARLLVLGKKIDLEFSVITNGTLITTKVAALLAEYNFSVTVSLDGPPQINDQVRPVKGGRAKSTAQVLVGLQELMKVRSGLKWLKVNSVFGSHNLAVRAAYEFLSGFHFDEYNMSYAPNAEDRESSEKYIEEMGLLAEQIFSEGGLEALGKISQFVSFFEQLDWQMRRTDFCGAGKSLIQTDTRGDLYACNWFMSDSEERMGHGQQVDENARQALSAPLIELNNCQDCWARYLCAGGCMFSHKTATGNRHSKDEWFCYRTRSLLVTALKFYALAARRTA
jgi:uncharacterized protein